MTDAQEPTPGQPTTERVRSIFSGIADKYDLFNILASMGIDRLWRKRVVAECRVDSTSYVLDLCAGTGDVAFAIARTRRPALVTVTDFTPEMLAVAERKAAADPRVDNVEFQLADAQDLPFPDESYDCATVAFGVRNLPDRAANFAEVLRVLRPGGRYIILEFSRPPFAPWRAIYHVYLHYMIPTLGGLLTGDRPGFAYLRDSIRAFPAQAELASELTTAGFSDVKWIDLTGGIVAIHVAVK